MEMIFYNKMKSVCWTRVRDTYSERVLFIFCKLKFSYKHRCTKTYLQIALFDVIFVCLIVCLCVFERITAGYVRVAKYNKGNTKKV